MNKERLSPEESSMDIEKMNKAAEEQGLPPLVRTNPDGSVEALPAEEAKALEEMLREEKAYEPVRPGEYLESLMPVSWGLEFPRLQAKASAALSVLFPILPLSAIFRW